MMRIEDIFSRPKKRTEKKRVTIEADYREKNSLVPSHLRANNIDIEFKELKVADFIIKGVAIERKTVSDFLASMKNKRLSKQCQELTQYSKRLLLIEGVNHQEIYTQENEEGKGMHANAIRGFLLSISLSYQVPIIYTKDAEDTAKFLSVLARKKESESPLQVTKKAHTPEEQKQIILESFPGIGPKTAKKLLKEYGSLEKVFTTPKEKLQDILGAKAQTFHNILNQQTNKPE